MSNEKILKVIKKIVDFRDVLEISSHSNLDYDTFLFEIIKEVLNYE